MNLILGFDIKLDIQLPESIKCMWIITAGYQNPKESIIWIL